MTKALEISGKTEDEAVSAALSELGLSRDDVSVEVVERAKQGFLGIGSSPAVVRVSYEYAEPLTEKTEAFLSGLIERMGLKSDISVVAGEGEINVSLTSSEPGALIGHRGETLDAIQHLCNFAIGHRAERRTRINIDAENYRQRRSETLEGVANKTVARVLKYRRNITLDPMNAYERHVIHTVLQDNPSVSTYSVGSEPNRRVVVAYGKTGNNNYVSSHS